MSPLVHRQELAELTKQPISEGHYTAVYDSVLTAIRAEYPDPEAATGRAADVVRSVALSVALRLVTNPAGARSVGLGSANVTFGGADAALASPAELTSSERQRLQRLKTGRRGVRSADVLLPNEDVLDPYAPTPYYLYGAWKVTP